MIELHPIRKEIRMKRFIYLIGLLSLLLSACAPQGPQTLTVLTHDSFSVSEDLIRQFETGNNVKISFVKVYADISVIYR